MEINAPTNSKARYVRDMFAQKAPHYDLVNRVISLGQDRNWRRLAANLAASSGNSLALDLATGTGELALELAKRAGHVVGVDFCPEMLTLAKKKTAQKGLQSQISFLLADALALPFPDSRFDCATAGFAMRNLDNIPRCFAELRRVLKPGGCVVCLELTRPVSSLVIPFHQRYLYNIVPFLGRCLSGNGAAYSYLADSLLNFPTAEELKGIMEEAGLHQVRYKLLNLGTVAIHTGLKSPTGREFNS